MAKLGDICTIQSGGTPLRSNLEYWDNGTIPWVKISDFDGKYLLHTSELISQSGLDNSSAKIFPKGTILYTIFATLGEVCILNIDAATNQAIVGLQITDDSVIPDFLYYYLLSKKAYVNEIGRGVAQNNINMSILHNMEVILPDVEVQAHIVKEMEKISSLISLRKQQLLKLEVLVKSQFIELFNGGQYPQEALDNNVIEMFIGPFGSSLKNECFVDEDDGFCMVYEQKHAIQKTMNVPTRYVPQSKYEELKRFTVVGGDIIVSCRGTIGEIFIVPDGAPMGIMHPSIMKIRLNTEKYNQKFFVFALEQYMKEHNAEAKGSGVKMAVSATVLGKSQFVIPPMDIQNQFAAFVEQTDKSKLAIQQSLDKLETLKGALMQKYFG